jgi:hypothetical protein
MTKITEINHSKKMYFYVSKQPVHENNIQMPPFLCFL